MVFNKKGKFFLLTALGFIVLAGPSVGGVSAGFFDGLKKKKTDIFAEANAAKAKEFSEKAGAHAPVKAGTCSKCHADPKDPAKLLQEAKLLCLSCHADRAEDLKKPVVHSAFAEMGCETCHVPHASGNAFLLSAPVNELCTNCHDITDEALKKGHGGISVFEGACTACHNPHASKKSKLILETKEHVPFGSRSCDMCHADAGAGGRAVLKETPGATCFICHSNFRKIHENPVVHMPVASGDCITCHNPHISVRGSLIRRPLADICFDCHDAGLKNTHPVTRHPTSRESIADPRREGKPYNCASCHDPHAGKLPRLMRGDIYVLCKECHKK